MYQTSQMKGDSQEMMLKFERIQIENRKLTEQNDNIIKEFLDSEMVQEDLRSHLLRTELDKEKHTQQLRYLDYVIH